MNEDKQQEDGKQIIHVYKENLNKTKFSLEPGKKVIIILENEEHDTSD